MKKGEIKDLIEMLKTGDPMVVKVGEDGKVIGQIEREELFEKLEKAKEVEFSVGESFEEIVDGTTQTFVHSKSPNSSHDELEKEAVKIVCESFGIKELLTFLNAVPFKDRKLILDSMTLEDVETYDEDKYGLLLKYVHDDDPHWKPKECPLCEAIADIAGMVVRGELNKYTNVNLSTEQKDDLRMYLFSVHKTYEVIKHDLFALNMDCKWFIVRTGILFEWVSKTAIEDEHPDGSSLLEASIVFEKVVNELKKVFGQRVSFDHFPKRPKYEKKPKKKKVTP